MFRMVFRRSGLLNLW